MIRNLSHHLLWLLVWGPVLFLTFLLAYNTLPYYWAGTNYGMLSEKQALISSPLYLTLFYLHVGPAILLLALPVFQFWARVTRKTAQWHVWLGSLYVYSTLFLVVPTGLYLALYAKGGPVAQWGFALQGILLGSFTWIGWQRIRKGKLKGHVEWMVRSYAMATAALTFRVLHISFFFIGIDDLEAYAASQWVSTALNLLLAELVVNYIRQRKLKKQLRKNEDSNSYINPKQFNQVKL